MPAVSFLLLTRYALPGSEREVWSVESTEGSPQEEALWGCGSVLLAPPAAARGHACGGVGRVLPQACTHTSQSLGKLAASLA